MSHKKLSTTVYLTPEQDEALKRLSGFTQVAVSKYIREGIDLVLAKHAGEVPAAHPFLMGVSK